MPGAGLLFIGLARIFQFMRLVMPILLHYKLKQMLGRFRGRAIPPEEWDVLHNHYAPKAVNIAERMQGFYIKIGQHLATMGSQLPAVYVDNLKSLLEHCPSQPFRMVRSAVETEIGPIEKSFESFNEYPMNAASTGQVHGARLLGGHDVVVKVQYPDAEWTFGVDVNLFCLVAEVMVPQVVGIVKQIRKNLVNEFDYVRESAQMREAAMHLEVFKNIVVPVPVDALHPQSPTPEGLCTKRVLVMDRLFGSSLADWGRAQLEAQAKTMNKSVRELQDEYMTMTSSDLEKLRPSPLAYGAYFMLSRGADLACNTMLMAYNWSLGYALRRQVQYVDTPLPPNIHAIARELMEAQGHMLFRSGFVNCDPHAGNVMLLEDGRLALIDWGQVVRLTRQQRCLLAGLYIAVADRDDIMSADCMRALGGHTKQDWDFTHSMWAKITTWSVQECEKNNFETLTKVMDKVDPTMIECDSVYIMTFKNQLYTRQVAAMLGFFSINSAVALRHLAQECLETAGWPVPRTMATFLPMPLQVRELMDLPAPDLERYPTPELAVKGAPDRDPGLLLVAAPPVIVSYTVYAILKLLSTSPLLRALAVLASCTGCALGMLGTLRKLACKRCQPDPVSWRVSSAGFNPNDWELALGTQPFA